MLEYDGPNLTLDRVQHLSNIELVIFKGFEFGPVQKILIW